MANWTIITINDLKAEGFGDVVDAAQTTAVGATDPVAVVIANAVSRVRRALGRRTLDANPNKVPNSLKDVACRLAFYALKRRINMPLEPAEEIQAKADLDDLKTLARDLKITVETPDNPAGSAEMQTSVVSETIQSGNFGNSREDLYRL